MMSVMPGEPLINLVSPIVYVDGVEDENEFGCRLFFS